MHTLSKRSLFLAGGAALLAAVLPVAAARAQAHAAKNRALFQVTDNDPARWNMILNNMVNLKEGVGSEGVEIELVAYGPGINMLKADSPVKHRVADALRSGVRVHACQNTMSGMKLAPADMLPEIGYVPSGVVEVMKKQQQGWAYIRSCALGAGRRPSAQAEGAIERPGAGPPGDDHEQRRRP
jgi:intracellular sulfur oxidation DsrE/DsrF family protein